MATVRLPNSRLWQKLIKTAYGKLPDRSYAGGTSNGGRHAMIAATRLGDQYDGILASTPVFIYLVQPRLSSTQRSSFVV